MNNWNNKDWNDTLRKAIYWYIIANNLQIDTGIILTQTSLEKLSYQYCKANSIKGCTDYKLETFFKELGIPDVIIDYIPDLTDSGLHIPTPPQKIKT